MAASDYKAFAEKHERARLLFVAHREEILRQSLQTFRQVLSDYNLSDWEYKNLGNRMQMQIRWNMVEPIPGSVMHFARMKEIV